MSNYVAVLPSIWPPYTDDCVATMSEHFHANTLIVDNHPQNIGVSKSWNLGVDYMQERQADWLILLSAAIRFHKHGDLKYACELQSPWRIVEARPVYGWHLIAFHRHIFDSIGRFDENFHSYFGDIDWSIRIQHAYKPADPPWNKVTVDVTDTGMAHGIKLAHADQQPDWQSADEAINYFKQKWGRHPGGTEPPYQHPFNNPDHGLDYWPCNHSARQQPSH